MSKRILVGIVAAVAVVASGCYRAYDGDAKTEPAWWSRTTGTWYIQDRDPVVFGVPGKTACGGGPVPPPECLTVTTTPIGSPVAARAAVIGAIPRLTYLRQCQLNPGSCS